MAKSIITLGNMAHNRVLAFGCRIHNLFVVRGPSSFRGEY